VIGFDFEAAVQAPFRMQPGLRRLAEGSLQLHPNARDSRHLLEKLQALATPAPVALQCEPGYDPMRGLRALATHAASEHPMAFDWDGETASARLLGWSVGGGELRPIAGDSSPMPAAGTCLAQLPPPWRLAGLLALAFAEDFALIDAATARIPWLAVALPSHWAPEHKVGLHFAQVHAPVADNSVLLAAGDALARLVSAPTRWERFVWTVTPRSTLNAHPALRPAAHWQTADADAVAAQAWWRTERQTFIPAADAGLAMFTILVDTQPLVEVIDHADKARRLHDAIVSMSPAVLQYRNLVAVRDPLVHWLARRASA
jgi:dimethylamine monooxygenase subunit A